MVEEILRNVSGDLNQQKAVQTLCQDIVNIMAAKYDNLGIVIFLRSDMAQNAITVNYEQFKQANGYAELKWTSDEALKLVVWVVSQAVNDFYEAKSPIENASKEVIDLHLEKLWGQKLGKTVPMRRILPDGFWRHFLILMDNCRRGISYVS